MWGLAAENSIRFFFSSVLLQYQFLPWFVQATIQSFVPFFEDNFCSTILHK